MKIRFLIALFCVLGYFVATIPLACKNEKGDCKGLHFKNSNGDEKSHNEGLNCLNCHYSGGPGEYCFTIGGTVYDSLQVTTKNSGTFKVFTGPNGTGDLVLSLNVDKIGNFYSGKNINFSGGLFPAITNSNGITKYMASSISTGACSSCHGNTTGKIWVP